MKLYTLYDAKAGSAANPFVATNDEVALRNLSRAVNDPAAGNLYSNPEDFVLYCAGSWEPETMEIKPHHPAMHIINAHSLVGRLDQVNTETESN